MAETATQRRHDLDALRAFAMLLGIALHAAMSFMLAPWPVQDTQQNALFGLFVAAVHGFRMQLFFLVSGFFTAMLWRKRGLKELLNHRFKRVFIPCLLGVLTIIPALHWVSAWAMESAKRERTARAAANPGSGILVAMRQKDLASVERLLVSGEDPNAKDAEFSVSMLSWAAMFGQADAVRLLLEKGANIEIRNGDGSTPLHGAAFLGHKEALEVLLSKGADAKAKNNDGGVASDAASADWGATEYIAGLLRIPIGSKEAVLAGREECKKLLIGSLGGAQRDPTTATPKALIGIRSAYKAMLSSDRLMFRRSPQAEPFHLVFTPFFDHLWFLWFLCWLVPVFVVFAWVADRRGWKGAPRPLILSPWRFCWLLPITMVPQLLMGVFAPSFGPDTAIGLLPQPHLLLYYGVFFAFGALYFDSDDSEGRLGRWWALSLPLALFVALPAGLATMQNPLLSGWIQVSYTWLMTFGMIGLFRRLLTRETKSIRYLSDASYWLYITHVPLVMVVQQWMRSWQLPSGFKFALICAIITGSLLISYQILVRYTWLGTLLNGPRKREGKQSTSQAA